MRYLTKWVLMLVAVVLAACGGGGGSPGANLSQPSVALYTTAPASLTLAVGAAQEFSIAGGSAPYTAVSNNTAIAVAGVKDKSLTLGGVAAGTADITVRDAVGASVSVGVTVSSGPVRALYTTAPASITVAVGAGAAQTYAVGGGTGPYTATSSNTSVAKVALVSGSLTVTGVAVGTTNIVILDAVGASVTVAVTVGSTALSVTPNNATGIIGDLLVATIIGGSPPYKASVGNVFVASAAVVNQNQLEITLKQTGQTIITVLDANNQSAAYSVTVNAATPGIRLSPGTMTVSERDATPIVLNVYGATGAVTAFSSNTALLSAEIIDDGKKVSVKGTGTPTATKCVDADTPVKITVIDSTGASAFATITITDNGTCSPSP